LAVEVGPEGVGYPDGGAAVTHCPFVLVETVVVTGIPTAALVGQGDIMRIPCVVGGQAPELVARALAVPLTVLLGAVAAEIEGKGIVLVHGQDVVQIHILALEHIFHVGGIQRGAEVVVELVAAAEHFDLLQSTTVTARVALAVLGVEATGMHGQAVDLVGGDHGAGVGFRQQAAVVVAQNRQNRTLVTVGQYGPGETCLYRRPGVGHIPLYIAIVIDDEEIDTALACTAAAAIQAIAIHAEGIHPETDGALGKAGVIGEHCALSPLGSVPITIPVITVHISITQKQVETAVL